MDTKRKKHPLLAILAVGLAMFSMFFGAGNIVFPLALGQYAEDKNAFAIAGLLISAVGVPFTGLIAMTLFNGNYSQFFGRLGKVPGLLLAMVIMGLIGPFGAIPRCIALAYSTIAVYFPEASLSLFSIASCILIFLLTFKKNNIVDILGYFLTPVLVIALAIIIVKGILFSPSAPSSFHVPSVVFFKGLLEGYQTMDLLGAFFFSSVVLTCLEREVATANGHKRNDREMIFLSLKASCIGAFLLSLTYVGFSFIAAFNSLQLENIKKEQLLSAMSLLILGPYAGLVACIAVALACLTTAVALASVFAEFIHIDIAQGKLGYLQSLGITLLISFAISTLQFTGIAAFLTPILRVCYPALILLSLLNITYKLAHFKPVKIPVLIAFLASLLVYGYF